jgi:starvation-inducible DNA-binding protein
MKMPLRRTSISGPDSEVTASHLQEVLADLIDLGLAGKQAHWNVVGPRFRALHLQLDQLVDHVRRYADTTAERIVTLGQVAQGSAENVHLQSKLDPLPTGFIPDDEVIKCFVERLDGVCGRIREHVRTLRDRDPVSEDLLVDILGTLEEQMWMFHAQAQ